jgi:hypothetical protein
MNQPVHEQPVRSRDPGTPDEARLAEAYAKLMLLPGASPALVRAAYRALARRHHPDAGGDPAAMQRLNDAYAAHHQALAERIRKATLNRRRTLVRRARRDARWRRTWKKSPSTARARATRVRRGWRIRRMPPKNVRATLLVGLAALLAVYAWKLSVDALMPG